MNRNVSSLVIVLLLAGVGFGDEKKSSSTSDRQDATRALKAYIDESVNWYRLYPSRNSDEPMVPLIVHRYQNNVRQSAGGTVVLWLDQGRPQAAASIFQWEDTIVHWFSSLSRGKIVARQGDVLAWHPEQECVKFRPIPDAPRPAETTLGRRRQLKSLAQRFTSTLLGWKDDDSDRESLRLLPTPLYRYESKNPDVLDGGVFAFVQGTDPESLLMIETVRVDEGYQWQFAFARQTSGALDGKYNGTVVWTAEKNPPAGGSDCQTGPSKPLPDDLKFGP